MNAIHKKTVLSVSIISALTAMMFCTPVIGAEQEINTATDACTEVDRGASVSFTGNANQVIYAGRSKNTVNGAIKIAEKASASLLKDGKVNFAYSVGGYFSTSAITTPTYTSNGLKLTCNTIPANTLVNPHGCYVSAKSSTTAGNLSYTFPAGFDLRSVTGPNELKATVSGNATSLWSGNTNIKLATIKLATISQLNGMPVMTTANNIVTIPEIAIRENNIGALDQGQIVLGLDDRLTVNSLPTSVVAYDLQGQPVNIIQSVYFTSANEIGNSASGINSSLRGLVITLKSSTANLKGPIDIRINGLKVATAANAPTGKYNITVAGSLTNAAITNKQTSDIGAKPWTQSFEILEVSTQTRPVGIFPKAIGPATNLHFSFSIYPKLSELNKYGKAFIFGILPPLTTPEGYIATDTDSIVSLNKDVEFVFLGPIPATFELPCNIAEQHAFYEGPIKDFENVVLVNYGDVTLYKGFTVFIGYAVYPEDNPNNYANACMKMVAEGSFQHVYTVQ